MRNYSPFEIMAARVKLSFQGRTGRAQMTSFWLPCSITWACPIDASPLQWRSDSPTKLSGNGTGRLKIAGKQVFIWSAIDVDRYEALAIKATASRTELETILFLEEVLKCCLNSPVILVDHGPWYPPALDHLGLRYKQVTFKQRNSIESWFHILKQKTKRFYNDFPFHASMASVATYLTSFVRMQNILTAKIT